MLHYAAYNGSSHLISYLLHNGLVGDVRNHSGETPLTMALVGNEVEAAIQLISAGAAYLETPNKNRISSLQAAALFDLTKAGRYLLDQQRVSPNEDTGREGWPPLYVASNYGSHNMARILMERGANPCKAAPSGWTPLHIASIKGDLKMLELLFSFKEELEVAPQNADGVTPLHCAAANGHIDVFDFLYKQQPVVPPSKFGNFPIHEAAGSSHISILGKFSQAEALTQNSRSRLTPLHAATIEGKLEVVEYLLDEVKVPIDAQAVDYRTPESVPREEALCITPLMNAIIGQNEVIVNALIRHGANIRAMTYNGSTTLLLAVETDLPSLVDELLRLKIDHTILTRDGKGVLHAAAAQSTPNLLRKILPYLKEHADFSINQQDVMGRTALMYACSSKSKGNIQLLLEEGSDILIASEVGHSAVVGDFDMLDVYLERGGDINFRDRSRMSLLHHAANSGNVKAIKALIRNHADIDAISVIDKTPLLLTVTEMNKEATEALIAGGADLSLRDASGRRALDYVTPSSPLLGLLESEGGTIRLSTGNGPSESYQNLGRFTQQVIKNLGSKPALSVHNFWQDYTELAFLFLCMGKERDFDTRVCLETRLTAVYGQRTLYASNCNGCSMDLLEGALHICRTCYMKILCHDCYEKRIEGEKNAPPKGCMPEHEYLEFGGADWRSLAPGTVNGAGETIQDFLHRIREEFRNLEFAPQVNGDVPEAHVQSEPGGQASPGVEMPDLANGIGGAIPQS